MRRLVGGDRLDQAPHHEAEADDAEQRVELEHTSSMRPRHQRHQRNDGRTVSLVRVELTPQEDVNRRMLRARDEMDRRYAEPLDVPTLAAIAHLSASQFGRVFKEVYGETPHRYLQRRRVERAMTLLRQTDRPVTDIAWDVGFASLGTFSRTFSTIVGCSPREFRVRHEPVHVPTLLHRGVDPPA